MLIIDSHAHLNFAAYDQDRDEVIKRALKNDVWLINVGTQKQSSAEAGQLALRYPEGVFSSAGLHPLYLQRQKHSDPWEAIPNEPEEFDSDFYRNLILENKKTVAVGETGLDFYKRDEKLGMTEEEKNLQKKVFEAHLKLALELQKPVIIHCRKAHDEILEILGAWQEKSAHPLKGVAHSFLGNLKQARHYRELGFKLAFNGIITFARDYDKVIGDTPLDDILIETDCPYLAPVPYRGQRNEPLYVIEVAKKLAEIKKIPYEEVVRQTTKNAVALFGL